MQCRSIRAKYVVAMKKNDDVGRWVEECAAELRHEQKEAQNVVCPTGSVGVRVGIVLDQAVYFGHRRNSGQTVPPWGITERGFNQSNSLVWPFRLRQGTLSEASHRVTPISARETAILRQFNRRLVEASNPRLILLCGHSAVQCFADNPKVNLSFAGMDYEAYIEFSGPRIQRSLFLLRTP